MDELQPNARALLDRARDAVEPSPDALAELGARLGIDPPPPPPPAANTPPTTPWLGWALAAALVVGLAGVAAVGTEPASTLSPAGFALPRLSAPETVVAPDVTPDAAPHPQSEPQPEPEPEPASAEAPAASPRKRRAKPSAAPEGLGAELALIVRARKALAAGRDREARRLAREYRSRFASGSFSEEAQVLELVASCHLDRDAKSIRAAKGYASKGDAAFARRVEAACLDPE